MISAEDAKSCWDLPTVSVGYCATNKQGYRGYVRDDTGLQIFVCKEHIPIIDNNNFPDARRDTIDGLGCQSRGPPRETRKVVSRVFPHSPAQEPSSPLPPAPPPSLNQDPRISAIEITTNKRIDTSDSSGASLTFCERARKDDGKGRR